MNGTVLFVDDEVDVLRGIERVLRNEGFAIVTAGSAEAALARLEAGGIDVIVSDERMPQTTGTELLGQVRDKHPGVIRIMLTGHARMTQGREALLSGLVFRFLTKPFEPRELAATLHSALRERKSVLIRDPSAPASD